MLGIGDRAELEAGPSLGEAGGVQLLVVGATGQQDGREHHNRLAHVPQAPPRLPLISSAYHLDEFFGVRFSVLKSTCTRPKRGPKPEPHSKLSISDQTI